MRTLRRGDRGREVVDLQTRLGALGFDLKSTGIDGVFRETTELADSTKTRPSTVSRPNTASTRWKLASGRPSQAVSTV